MRRINSRAIGFLVELTMRRKSSRAIGFIGDNEKKKQQAYIGFLGELPPTSTSTALPLAVFGNDVPSASLLNKDLSSISSTLPYCSPSVQGSVLHKLRLPTSLDSLKPSIFYSSWEPGVQLAPISDAGERVLVAQLIAELNTKFNVNLDPNFTTCRDVELNLDNSATEVPNE